MATVNGTLSPPLHLEAASTPLSAKRKREDSVEDDQINGSGNSNSTESINDIQTLVVDLVDVLES